MEIIEIIAIVGIVVIVFFACREIFCWYWKINQVVTLLTEVRGLLKEQNLAAGIQVDSPLAESELTEDEAARRRKRYSELSTDELERLRSYAEENLERGTVPLIDAELEKRHRASGND